MKNLTIQRIFIKWFVKNKFSQFLFLPQMFDDVLQSWSIFCEFRVWETDVFSIEEWSSIFYESFLEIKVVLGKGVDKIWVDVEEIKETIMTYPWYIFLPYLLEQ